MATLSFKGKNIIWNHHLSVPYHALDLDEKLSFNKDKSGGNLIIEGDNLPALKSLLPQYTGKIKCIYIDPPYNTGEENWIYNDNVNSPLIKEWIGKVVGRDDLTRHDKWLAMMTPRLKLLRELLIDDGVIFISIDDNEIHHLRNILDEVFGNENLIGTFIWNKKDVVQNDAKFFSYNHEYVVCYRKSDKRQAFNLLIRSEDAIARYVNPDNDVRGDWVSVALQAKSGSEANYYEIEFPNGVKWRPVEGTFPRLRKETLLQFYEDNRIWFGRSGKNVPRLKKFLSEVRSGVVSNSILLSKDVGSTQMAKEEIKKLLDSNNFDTPKPTGLIKRLINLSSGKDDTVLDAFAGSGTTGQAVLELNEEDNGNRKFILIQIPENNKEEPDKNICRDITRERVVKVIEKKLTNKEIGFEYKKVGQQIDAETILSGKLPTFEQLAKYVFYLATGQSPKEKDINEKNYLAGKIDHTEVYLLYKQDMEELQQLALTFDWAKEISEGNSNKKIIYAPACFLDDEYMEKFNMKFVSIPYNLFERQK